MKFFKTSSKFGCATVIGRGENKIQKLFECRRVTRRAPQNSFEQADGFLREAVAREQIDVRERLGDKFLRVFVECSSQLRRVLLLPATPAQTQRPVAGDPGELLAPGGGCN